MEMLSSPFSQALRSPLAAYAGDTPSTLRLQFGCGAFGQWTPAGAMRSGGAARATPPFLRGPPPDGAVEDAESARQRWAGVSSASTQVYQSVSGGESERALLVGCAAPLEDEDPRCVSAALALALARSAPPSPLVCSPPPRAGRAKAAPPAKKAAAGGGVSGGRPARAPRQDKKKTQLQPLAPPLAPPATSPPPARCSKRKRYVPVASLPSEHPSASDDDDDDDGPHRTPGYGARRGVTGSSWTAEEDSALLQLTRVYGERDWTGVAAALDCGRSAKQARERFMYIKPGVRRGPWSDAEETAMVRHQKQLGNRWAEIARRMSRPENTVKNRWYGRLRRERKAAAAAAAPTLVGLEALEAAGAADDGAAAPL